MTDLRYATVTRPASQVASDALDRDRETPCSLHVRMFRRDPWHPEINSHSDIRARREAAYDEARTICQACPIRVECLNWAMTREGRWAAASRQGMWGGLDPVERAALAKHTGVKGRGRPLKPIAHGTPRGYWMHADRKEPACDLCRDAHNTARRERAEANRKAAK